MCFPGSFYLGNTWPTLVFLFPGSLPWLPVVSTKVQTFQNNPLTLYLNGTFMQFDPEVQQFLGINITPVIGLDQTKKLAPPFIVSLI